jgi:hypothetical protein
MTSKNQTHLAVNCDLEDSDETPRPASEGPVGVVSGS